MASIFDTLTDQNTGVQLVKDAAKGYAFRDATSGQVLHAKDEHEAKRYLAAGFVPETEEQFKERVVSEEYDAPVRAGLVAALSGATMGASNVLFGERAKILAEQNPAVSTISEMGGGLALLAATGAGSGAARLAASKAGKVLLGSAAEGALLGASEAGGRATRSGAGVDEYVSQALEGAALGGVLGGGLGLAGLGISSVARFAGKKAAGPLKGLADKVRGGAQNRQRVRALMEEVAQEQEALAPLRQRMDVATKRRMELESLDAIAGQQNLQFREQIVPLKQEMANLTTSIAKRQRASSLLSADADATLVQLDNLGTSRASAGIREDLLDSLAKQVASGSTDDPAVASMMSRLRELRAQRSDIEKKMLSDLGMKGTDYKRIVNGVDKELRAAQKAYRLRDFSIRAKQKEIDALANNNGLLGNLVSASVGAVAGSVFGGAGAAIGGGMGFQLGATLGRQIVDAALPAIGSVTAGVSQAAGRLGGAMGAARPLLTAAGIQKLAEHGSEPELSADEYRTFASEVHDGMAGELLQEASLNGDESPDYTAASQLLAKQVDYLKSKVPEPNPLEPEKPIPTRERKTAGRVVSALANPAGAMARMVTGKATPEDLEVLGTFHASALEAMQMSALRYMETAQRENKKLDRKTREMLAGIIGRKLGLQHPERRRILQSTLAKGSAKRLDAPRPSGSGIDRNMSGPSSSSDLEGV